MLSSAIFVIIRKFCFIAGTPKRPGDAPSGAVFIVVGKFYFVVGTLKWPGDAPNVNPGFITNRSIGRGEYCH